MKVILVFAAVVAVALAGPLEPSKTATILRYENDNIGVDGYKYAYETSDGQTAYAQGELKNFGPETNAVVSQGSFSFVSDDGVTYTINWVADENGYRADGAHVPTL
uniref:Putative cuticular protein 21 rr-1 family n=1 Tax=Lutzomyia longipalpis TaxID=7200 RepID=A0A1B0FV53_LUTLO